MTSGAIESASTVQCVGVNSPANGRIENAMFNEVYKPGHELMFECFRQYELIGSPVLTCMGNGSWSSSVPVCQRTYQMHALSINLPAYGEFLRILYSTSMACTKHSLLLHDFNINTPTGSLFRQQQESRLDDATILYTGVQSSFELSFQLHIVTMLRPKPPKVAADMGETISERLDHFFAIKTENSSDRPSYFALRRVNGQRSPQYVNVSINKQ